MPIYEYRCRNCHATFEILVRAGTAVTCSHCGSSSLDKLVSAPLYRAGRRPDWRDVPAAVGRSGVTQPPVQWEGRVGEIHDQVMRR
jgi:putative FmdB family regulatory protein